MENYQILWILLQVAFVGFLVALNGFFVAAEFALVKIRDSQLKPLINDGNPRAIMTGKVLDNLDSSLSACQLGITLASLALGWVGEPVFAGLLEPIMHAMAIESEKLQHMLAFLFGFSAITFLHITAGEQAPKLMAIQKPLPTSLWIAKPLWLFCKISYPFIWALNKASNRMLRWVGIESVSEHELLHSEEELRMLISDTHHHQGGTKLEKEIVFNAMELRQRLVREVMRPRPEISLLSTEMSLEKCLAIMEKERYSRYPLCTESDLDKVLGVVHFKELYSMRNRFDSGQDLVQISRKILHFPETSRLEKALRLFLKRRLHLAMVVDEYGSTVGMITLEDILEELVGEIQDEFDQEQPLIIRHTDGSYDIMGLLPLHELSELIGTSIQEEGINTVSGWMTHKLGEFPEIGDIVEEGNHIMKVLNVDSHRIERLHLKLSNTANSDNPN
ncbi:MAG: HlyC/CorC family transporter [Verrucomicrobia bacterium]|jgi:CBS domain containing-hemolysin-like protein|nr:HlyC/CorC family transporter [Verrucomicrobiota bacterium]